MREPEITTVTLQRVHWPLTETDLRELVIAALGDRLGAAAAEEVARSDGAFQWRVKDGLVIGAEIDLSVEGTLASPIAIESDEPIEVPAFRSVRCETHEAAAEHEVSSEAGPSDAVFEEAIDPMSQHLDHLNQPEDWPRERDLELLDMALNGYGTDDCALAFARPPKFIRDRFDQLTGKLDGVGHVFTRIEVHRALAAGLGVAVE